MSRPPRGLATRCELTSGLGVRLAADRQVSAGGRRRRRPRLVPSSCVSALDVTGLDEQAGGAEEEAMAVITIQGLTKRFGQVVAVDD
jgi:hypothetical protein